MSASDRARQLTFAASEAAQDKLATDIVAIDVTGKLALADVFVVCSAANDRQVSAVVKSVEQRLLDMGEKPVHREGNRDSQWVLIVYSDLVIHVQNPEAREYYQLERLWNDCPEIALPVADVRAAVPAGAVGAR